MSHRMSFEDELACKKHGSAVCEPCAFDQGYRLGLEFARDRCFGCSGTGRNARAFCDPIVMQDCPACAAVRAELARLDAEKGVTDAR